MLIQKIENRPIRMKRTKINVVRLVKV